MFEPKRGDFIVFQTWGWAARLIQFGTRSRWNHAAIYAGQGMIVEANPNGVQATTLSSYMFGTWVSSRVPLTDLQRDAIVHEAWVRRGTRYGWLDIVALAAVQFDACPKWLRARAERDDRLVCSQLVSVCYEAAGVPLTKDVWSVTPGDLADEILETP